MQWSQDWLVLLDTFMYLLYADPKQQIRKWFAFKKEKEKVGCLGANPGSFIFHLFSRHSSSEQQRLYFSYYFICLASPDPNE
jgi:hypothetical protein